MENCVCTSRQIMLSGYSIYDGSWVFCGYIHILIMVAIQNLQTKSRVLYLLDNLLVF